jgi:hypothetical protein
VSGGQAGAQNGVLTVMCGGDAEPYGRAEKVIAAYARMCKLLGPAGAGQLTKMVNQICIAGLVQGLSEASTFAKKAGLDVEAVIETISKGAAQSWQMENRYKTMNAGKYDFGFAVDWMRKDLSICLARRAAPARTCRSRAGRSVLFGSPEDGRRALGHVEPAGRLERESVQNVLGLQSPRGPIAGGASWPRVKCAATRKRRSRRLTGTRSRRARWRPAAKPSPARCIGKK